MLSDATRREHDLWLLEDLVPGTAVNNLAVAFEVSGELSLPSLRWAASAVVDKHPWLRTTYQVVNGRLRRSRRQPGPNQVAVEPIGAAPCAGSGTAALTAFVNRPFPLDGTLLLRIGLLRERDRDVVCLTAHHLVFDATSAATFLGDLVAAYEHAATSVPLPAGFHSVPEPVDVVPSDRSIRFWREHLSGFTAAQLGLQCGRDDDRPTFTGRIHNHVLSRAAADGLTALHRQLRTPKAALLLGCYSLMLARHGAGPDLAVGVPVDLRTTALRGAVGYYVNMLPLRVRVEPEATVRNLLEAVRTGFFAALSHADAPAETFQTPIRTHPGSWRPTLFRHVFNYVPQDLETAFTLAGLPARRLPIENGTSKYDLEFLISETGGTSVVSATFSTRVFELEEVRLLTERYDEILQALPNTIDATVGELSILSPRDRTALGRSRPIEQVTGGSVLDALHHLATTKPDDVAVVEADRQVSYGQLWTAAETTAAALREGGVPPGTLVALVAERGVRFATGLLGCWLAGLVCVPCPPGMFSEQGTAPASDAVLIAGPGAHTAMAWVAIVPVADPGPTVAVGPRPVHPDSSALRFPVTDPDPGLQMVATEPASTIGAWPVRRVVSHQALWHAVAQAARQLSVTPPDVVLWSAPVTRPESVLELLVALVCGASAAIRPVCGALPKTIQRHGPTVMQLEVPQLRELMRADPQLLKGVRLCCYGERPGVGLVRRVLDHCDELHTAYRPGTAAFPATLGHVVEAETAHVALGWPIRPEGLQVVDGIGRPMPIGLRGPLLATADDGIGRATGDHGVLGEDGALRLVDWTEPAPVGPSTVAPAELACLSHPEVWAVTLMELDPAGDDQEIVAVVEPDPALDDAASAVLADELSARCQHLPPGAVVPSRIVAVRQLPVTRTGLVDSDVLRSHIAVANQPVPAAPPAGDTVLAALVSLWGELLGTDAVTEDSHFFDQGGQSLLGAQLVSRIRQLTGAQLKLADLFDRPTPQEMGRLLAELGTRNIGR